MPDIILNMKIDDYVISDAVIDPVTKDNVQAYIIKENGAMSFGFANHEITSREAKVENIYYTSLKNKNLIIKSREFTYTSATDIFAIYPATYDVLKATNRISDCLFKFTVKYNVIENNVEKSKEAVFYLKAVSESEYEAYKGMVKKPEKEEVSGEIKRPKKQAN